MDDGQAARVVTPIVAPVGGPEEEELHLRLKRPIQHGNVTYDTLSFREPTAAELRRSANGAENGTHQTMLLAQIVAGVPMRVIEGMAASDFARVASFFASFMAVSGETGPS